MYGSTRVLHVYNAIMDSVPSTLLALINMPICNFHVNLSSSMTTKMFFLEFE